MSFKEDLLDILVNISCNYYVSNLDLLYYESYLKKQEKFFSLEKIKAFFIRNFSKLIPKKYLKRKFYQLYIKNLKYDCDFLYDNLIRQEDKLLLLKIIAYKILGYKKVCLTNFEIHNKLEQDAKKYIHFDDYIWVLSENYKYKLYKIDFKPKDYQLYSNMLQYVSVINENAYSIPGLFYIKEGDYVFDCGAFVLDNTIPFADIVGEEGKVFAIEFIPCNLAVCYANLKLNQKLKDRIELITAPISEKVGETLYFKENSSCSTLTKNMQQAKKFISTTIDEIVEKKKIKKVDFIKMDIEGSEIFALKGAKKTILKYKPKLAISFYHRPGDFEEIPHIIKSYDNNYKFYISYSGCSDSEYILCAQIEKN